VASSDSNTAIRGRNAPIGRSLAPSLEDEVRSAARRLGFAACGLTGTEDLDCGPILADWLEAGRHGDMDYLATMHERRLRPRLALEGARSAIVVAWSYSAPLPQDPDWRELLRGRVAAYAIGPDYHAHVADKLRTLARWIAERTGCESVVHVDGGPLVEKDLARRAGLGWYGRNTNLVRPGIGSTFVLGVIVTRAELAADPSFAADHCGTCRACVPACPTGALDSGPTIDARLCISYLTIEHRGPVPTALRSRMGNWVFGCDACQDVCPWNEESTAPNALARPWLPGWLAMTEEEFRANFSGTALIRPKRRGLARNAAIVLGNTGNPAAVPFLARALESHDEPIVRAHAAWSLGAIATADAHAALRGSYSRERVPPVRREIEAAIGVTTSSPANAI